MLKLNRTLPSKLQLALVFALFAVVGAPLAWGGSITPQIMILSLAGSIMFASWEELRSLLFRQPVPRPLAPGDQLQELVITAVIPAAVLDTQSGRLRTANTAFLRLTGHAAAELGGMPHATLTSGKDELAPGIKHYRRRDGTMVLVHESLKPTSDSRALLVAVELTGLEQMLDQLRVDKATAEAASQTKSEFLANMSHEIRTPLSAIIGFTEFLMDPLQTPADRLQCVRTIRRNGELLAHLINDLLDISKIEANRMEIELLSVSPAEVIREVSSLLNPKAAEKGLSLRFTADESLPAQIISDPTRLRQILTNLICNAVKFTDSGAVDVSARLTQQPGGQRPALEVEVRDTGVGMTLDQQVGLFQAYNQADRSTARRYGGTGLGLMLARRLARALGGDVFLKESIPDKGSSFVFWLDLSVPSAHERSAEGRPASPGALSDEASRSKS